MKLVQRLRRVATAPVLVVSKLLVFLMVLAAGEVQGEESLVDIKDGDTLKTWFKKHDGKPRLILFLSPT